MEELKEKVTRKDEVILQAEYSFEREKRSNKKLQEDKNWKRKWSIKKRKKQSKTGVVGQ